MKKLLFLLSFLFLSTALLAQTVAQKIVNAYHTFLADPQLKNAIASLHIIDAKTGKVVFSRNSTIGLAPASTQKIITSATAYELLGKDFRYITEFARSAGDGENNNVYILASGDPTLGSWRWKNHSEEEVMKRIMNAFRINGISSVGNLLLNDKGWQDEYIPDGWIWQDAGNYYGAGAEVLNWRENQYDLLLKSGSSPGDSVIVTGTVPFIYDYSFRSFVTSAAKGTGDRSYIYLPLSGKEVNVRGTIPLGENRFVVSGAMPSPRSQFMATLIDSLQSAGISYSNGSNNISALDLNVFHQENSPLLDSISYWFLKRSINLYGEALVKTFANKNKEEATASNGIKLLKDFWADKGIYKTELNMYDGSGLSPLNRVTTNAQVKILAHAKKQSWFNGFFVGFPEFNGMKMKSGTISGVKGFCGYHTSSTGKEYIFSFIVNNYNGSASSLVQKMYKVLNTLK